MVSPTEPIHNSFRRLRELQELRESPGLGRTARGLDPTRSCNGGKGWICGEPGDSRTRYGADSSPSSLDETELSGIEALVVGVRRDSPSEQREREKEREACDALPACGLHAPLSLAAEVEER